MMAIGVRTVLRPFAAILALGMGNGVHANVSGSFQCRS